MSPSLDGLTSVLGPGSQGLVPSLPAWPGLLRTRRCSAVPRGLCLWPSLRGYPAVALSPLPGAPRAGEQGHLWQLGLALSFQVLLQDVLSESGCACLEPQR